MTYANRLVATFFAATYGLALAGHAQPCEAPFFDFQTFPAGISNHSVATADFDTDGDTDALVTNNSGFNSALMLNNGDGTFQPPIFIQTGPASAEVIAADLNGDGNADLAVINTRGELNILLGNGDATFQPRVVYQAGSRPDGIDAGDLDGDGDPDIVVANKDSNNLSVFLNAGDGSFAPHATIPVLSAPTGVTIADLDLDGDQDLAVCHFGFDRIRILENIGAAAFSIGDSIIAGKGHDIEAGDVNEDGYPDLAFASNFPEAGIVLLNPGAAVGEPWSVLSVIPTDTNTHPREVELADMNADTLVDLVIGTTNQGIVCVALSLGADGFAPPSCYSRIATGIAAGADITGDGHADLLAVGHVMEFAGTPQQGTLLVLQGLGNGEFAVPNAQSIGGRSAAAITADMNGDGFPDLISARQENAAIGIVLGIGDGTLGVPQYTPSTSSIRRPLYAIDADADGDLDLGVGSQFDMSLFLNAADGFSHVPQAYSQEQFIFADINTDGSPDIASSTRNEQFHWALGNGDGSFQQAGVHEFSAFDETLPGELTAFDADADGDDDILIHHQNGSALALFLNNGDGTFAPESTIDPGLATKFIAHPADLDGDGLPDLAVSNNWNSIQIMRNNGGTAFTQSQTMPIDFAVSIITIDLDSDGDLDIVTGGNAPTIALNDGSGTFTIQPDALTSAFDILAVDVNADGSPDITGTYFSDLIVMVNDGTGQLTRSSYYTDSRWSGIRLIGTDLDQNGSTDFIVIDNDEARLFVSPCGTTDCGPADLAPPAGILDLSDVNAFVAAFVSAQPAADLATPTGLFDLADIVAFLTEFQSGCP